MTRLTDMDLKEIKTEKHVKCVYIYWEIHTEKCITRVKFSTNISLKATVMSAFMTLL